MSLPARGVWIEIEIWYNIITAREKSLPARGVWIEMCPTTKTDPLLSVTPREGSVD